MAKILAAITEFFRSIFGINKKSKDLTTLEKKVKLAEERIKEIEDEESNIDDIINRFNK